MNPCSNCSKIWEGVIASRLRGEYSFERFNNWRCKKYCTYVIIDLETVYNSVSRAVLERGKSKGEIYPGSLEHVH